MALLSTVGFRVLMAPQLINRMFPLGMLSNRYDGALQRITQDRRKNDSIQFVLECAALIWTFSISGATNSRKFTASTW